MQQWKILTERKKRRRYYHDHDHSGQKTEPFIPGVTKSGMMVVFEQRQLKNNFQQM